MFKLVLQSVQTLQRKICRYTGILNVTTQMQEIAYSKDQAWGRYFLLFFPTTKSLLRSPAFSIIAEKVVSLLLSLLGGARPPLLLVPPTSFVGV
jgi:hypothetical protein